MRRAYRIRYTIEGDGPYTVPAENRTTRIQDGIRVSQTDYGYADDILLVSVLRDKTGAIDSLLMLTSEDGRDPRLPTPGLLRAVRDLIDHHLQAHTTETDE